MYTLYTIERSHRLLADKDALTVEQNMLYMGTFFYIDTFRSSLINISLF